MNNKILIIIPFITIGGAEKSAWLLLNSLREKGYTTLILTFEKNEHEFSIKDNRVNVPTIPYLPRTLQVFYYAIYLYFFIKKHKITTAITFLDYSNFSALLVKLINKNFKLIVTERGNPNFKIWQSKIVMKYLYKFADAIVVQNQNIKKILYTMNIKNNIHVIPNIYMLPNKATLSEKINEELSEKIDRDVYKIVSIGRFSKEKNHILQLEVINALRNQGEQVQLLVVGDGEKKKEIIKKISDLQLQNHVLLCGMQKNVYPYLLKSDLFLHTSFNEGFPNVLLEAMYCNLPVVTMDCKTGPREIILDIWDQRELNYPYISNKGIITQYYNPNCAESIESLANAILYMKKQKNRRNKEVSIDNVEPYLKENIITKWKKVIEFIHKK